MYIQIGLTGLLLYLAAAARRDIREKKISVSFAAVFAALAFIWRCTGAANGEMERLLSFVTGLVPGGLMLLAGYVTREAIGYGDAAAVLVIGIFLGFWGSAEIVLAGLLFSCPVSLFLLTVKRAPRNQEMPFIPFLLAGYIVYLLVQ